MKKLDVIELIETENYKKEIYNEVLENLDYKDGMSVVLSEEVYFKLKNFKKLALEGNKNFHFYMNGRKEKMDIIIDKIDLSYDEFSIIGNDSVSCIGRTNFRNKKNSVKVLEKLSAFVNNKDCLIKLGVNVGDVIEMIYFDGNYSLIRNIFYKSGNSYLPVNNETKKKYL